MIAPIDCPARDQNHTAQFTGAIKAAAFQRIGRKKTTAAVPGTSQGGIRPTVGGLRG